MRFVAFRPALAAASASAIAHSAAGQDARVGRIPAKLEPNAGQTAYGAR